MPTGRGKSHCLVRNIKRTDTNLLSRNYWLNRQRRLYIVFRYCLQPYSTAKRVVGSNSAQCLLLSHRVAARGKRITKSIAVRANRRDFQAVVELHCFCAHESRGEAMAALDAHIRRSLEPNIDHLKRIGSIPEALRPPFLIQVGGTRNVRAVRGSDY